VTDAAQELVDIIDDAGNTIGVVSRCEMRQRRLPHRSVYILVFNSRGQLFIHQRTVTKDVYASCWDVTIGGVLAAGETFDLGAEREATEEIGVALRLERLFPIRYEDEHSIAQGMVYRGVHDGPFRLQPEEIVRGEFASLDEVIARTQRDPFCPDGLMVLAEYGARLRQGSDIA
jgi:isopentenyldiphosphate isomerase